MFVADSSSDGVVVDTFESAVLWCVWDSEMEVLLPDVVSVLDFFFLTWPSWEVWISFRFDAFVRFFADCCAAATLDASNRAVAVVAIGKLTVVVICCDVPAGPISTSPAISDC